MTLVIDSSTLPSRGERTKEFEGARHGGVSISFLMVDIAPSEGARLHVHPYEEVFVVEEGVVTFTVGDETLEVRGGQIVVAPPGVPHSFVNSGSSRLRSINIHPVGDMVTEWLED